MTRLNSGFRVSWFPESVAAPSPDEPLMRSGLGPAPVLGRLMRVFERAQAGGKRDSKERGSDIIPRSARPEHRPQRQREKRWNRPF